jgi:hypothetical protein
MELAHELIEKCKSTGILTEASIRKYPLRSGNIAVVLKAYALKTRMPFIIETLNLTQLDVYKLYLTPEGLDWLINEFKGYTLAFLRTGFQFVFSKAGVKDLEDIESYQGLNNFKGLVGINYKVGTMYPAVLVRKYGKNGSMGLETKYDTLAEARKDVLHLTRFYPADQFTLYRLSLNKKNGVYYKHKVPLFLEENRRGLTVNLPHLKGHV